VVAQGLTHPADALAAWVRAEGTPVTLTTVVRPPYVPGQPDDPVVTDHPGVVAIIQAGGPVQTRAGVQETAPALVIAADDAPAGLDTSSRATGVPPHPDAVLQVQRVRIRRVEGRAALCVLELQS
jgi:hypothetical protein